jgi:biotin carboxyl carrier protein
MAEVKAELVGSLWKIVTEVGQAVEEDDTLMILESMKMEIPITSPITGTVTAILVREGDVVQEGQTVAIVE